MPKLTIDASMDAALGYVQDRAEYEVVCATEPTTWAEAMSGASYYIGKVSVTSANFSITDGTVSGRKLVAEAQASVPASLTSLAQWAVLVTSAGASAILLRTGVVSQVITSGNPMNLPSFKWEIADPT